MDPEEIEEQRRRSLDDARERRERLYAGDWLGGRLLAYGSRHHPLDEQKVNGGSYYVRLQTRHGRQTLWGRDLERAIRESKSHVKVGDAVGVRITHHQSLPGDKTFNHWEVERAVYIVQRRRTAREILDHPITARQAGKEGATVTGSYLLITGAEMLARIQYSDEETRRRFVQRVREAAGIELRPYERPAPGTPTDRGLERRPAREQDTNTPARDGFARE